MIKIEDKAQLKGHYWSAIARVLDEQEELGDRYECPEQEKRAMAMLRLAIMPDDACAEVFREALNEQPDSVIAHLVLLLAQDKPLHVNSAFGILDDVVYEHVLPLVEKDIDDARFRREALEVDPNE